jgi:mediator of RNA polymerase II transcription subunit 10
MSGIPPHLLPSPAPSDTISLAGNHPFPHPDPTDHMSLPPTQAQLRATLEAQLLRLTQDLYEMEVCAGDVVQDREDAVADYL